MGKMIIVVAPSGAGKSTFIDEILDKRSFDIKDLITYTTREMRDGESQGVPYYFISKEDFEAKIEKGFFVEWARVHSSLYGSSHDQIRDHWSQGHAVIMDIDIQGAETFKSKFPEAITVFIQPPSLEALKERLLVRGGGVLPPDFDMRMESAKLEMEWSKFADHVVVNDEFDKAFKEFANIVEHYINS